MTGMWEKNLNMNFVFFVGTFCTHNKNPKRPSW